MTNEIETSIPFRLVALPHERFAHLFSMSDEELLLHGAQRRVADSQPGYPCRVSLRDAEVGEEVILVPFEHHDTASPYRATGPIYVRQAARRVFPEVNEVPEMIRRRFLSIRAYDAAGMMVGADVIDGRELEQHVTRFFQNPSTLYLHLHNARPGCYNCLVERA
jgi:hypothetical protein